MTMHDSAKVIGLHPPLTPPKVMHLEGEAFVTVSGIIQMARDGNTDQCRSLVRFYNAEYRTRQAQPITPIALEWEAFAAAWDRMVRKFGVAPIADPKTWPGQ